MEHLDQLCQIVMFASTSLNELRCWADVRPRRAAVVARCGMNITEGLDVGVTVQFVDCGRKVDIRAAIARPVVDINDGLKRQGRVCFGSIVKLLPARSVGVRVYVERKEH